MVKLVLCDDTEIEFPDEAVKYSGFIQRMQEDIIDSDEPIPLLDKTCTKELIDDIIIYSQFFLEDNLDKIKNKIHESSDERLFNLMEFSNFFEFNELLNNLCLHFAEEIKKCKTPEDIRKRFNITTEFSPAEEEEARNEFSFTE